MRQLNLTVDNEKKVFFIEDNSSGIQLKDIARSEERREGKSVDLGGRRIIKKKSFFKQKTAYEISSPVTGVQTCALPIY